MSNIQKIVEHTPVGVKHAIDWTAVGLGVGSFLDWMPKVAALFSAVWLALQIYSWVEKRAKARRKK